MHNGAHNAPSNVAFDQFLKARSPAWGLRDIVDLERTALASGIRLDEAVETPANNTLVVFHRAA